VELWLRASIEAARASAVVRAATGLAIDDIAQALDRYAQTFIPTLTGDTKLLAYRRLLLDGEAASVTLVRAEGNLELQVPLEIAVAWRREASTAGRNLDDWLAAQLALTHDEALTWEATAAACGAGLAEWAYACFLRRITCLSA
jgi:hypothetical protein